MINTLLSLAVALGVFFVPNLAQSQEKFKTGISYVRKALREGKITEAVASYELQAREAEEKSLTAESPRQYLMLSSRAYTSACRAARYAGRLQKAINYCEKGLEIAQKTGDPVTQLKAIDSTVLTYTLNRVGRHKEADRLVDEGFKLVISEPFRSDPWSLSSEASLYYLRGKILNKQQKYGKAIPVLTKSIYLREAYIAKHLGSEKGNQRSMREERNGVVLSLRSLAKANRGLGKVELALKNYQRALSLFKEWELRSNVESILHTHIGQLHYREKRYPEALESFQRSLALAETRRRRSTVARTSRQIGRVLSKMGKYSEAIVYYDKAIQGVESTRSLLEADYRKSYFEGSLSGYVGIVKAYERVGKPEEAFNYSERARSRLFLDLLGNRVELSRSKSGLREEEKALNEQLGVIKNKLARKASRRGLEKN